MENITLPLAALADVVGKPVTELQTIFIDTEKTKPDGEKFFLEGDAAISKVKEIFVAEQDRFKKLGARNRQDSFETNVRKEFEINDPAQGEDLIRKLVSREKEMAKKLEADLKAEREEAAKLKAQIEKGLKLDGDDLTRFVVNSDAHKGIVSELEKARIVAETKLAETVQQYERRDLDKRLRASLSEAFNEYSPNIGGTPEQVARQKELFVEKLMNEADWRDVNGKMTPYEKGRNLIATNRKQHEVDLKGFVFDQAEQVYPQNAADPTKYAPGSMGKAGGGMPDFRGKGHEEVLNIILTYQGKPNEKEVEEAAYAYLQGL